MATWNGNWLFGNEEFQTAVAGSAVSDLPDVLMQLDCVKTLIVQFECHLARRCEKLGFKFWSYQFEVSLKSDDKGRVHVHAYWHDDSMQSEARLYFGSTEAWSFLGAKPMIRPNMAKGNNARKAIDRGHFYCQCLKVGRMESNTNFPKHEAFSVEQKWIIALWKQRKLSHDDARTEILLARGHTQSYLREIDFVRNLEERIEMEKEKAAVDMMITGAFKPFVEIPEVELWALQYRRQGPFGQYGKASRFKFLVLTGPSSLGKTQFAKSLFGPEATLVVPCQGVKQPALKDFKRHSHRAVLFDEISSQCIHDNKAVFQANNDIVLLGQIPCQEYV